MYFAFSVVKTISAISHLTYQRPHRRATRDAGHAGAPRFQPVRVRPCSSASSSCRRLGASPLVHHVIWKNSGFIKQSGFLLFIAVTSEHETVVLPKRNSSG